jgi:predicted GIY-YIG superfamily endonuclease
MQFWVYILRCRDGSYYVGHTDDLQKRLWEHEQGLAADWTRRRRPVELVWSDWANSRDDAFAFERRVKNWSRAKKEALIAGDWRRVGHFARPPHERPSTTLGTSEKGTDLHHFQPAPESLVPSEAEARASGQGE